MPLRIVCLLTGLILLTAPLKAGWVTKQLSDLSYEAGVSIPSTSISVEGSDAAGAPLKGVLIGQFLPRPVFGITSSPHYFWDGGLDYNFIFSFVWANLDQQEIDGQSARIGTQGDAYSIYTLPTLGYTFGDREFVKGKGKNLRLGLGVGAGWLIAKGTVLMTQTVPTLLDLEKSFNFNKPTIAAAGLIDFRWNDFGLRFQIDGPNLDDGGFKYSFLNLSLRAAYSYSPGEFMEKQTKHKQEKRSKKRQSRWTGELVATGGGRSVPITGSSNYDTSTKETPIASGGGLLLHIKKEHWPLGIVIDGAYYASKSVSATTQFFDAQALSKTADIQGWTSSVNIGFRNTWRSKKTWQPFVGGGFTAFFSGVEGSLDGKAVADRGLSFGFYLGGGMNFIFRKHYSLGVEGRMFNGTTELLGAREDLQGGQINFTGGWHF